MHFPIHYEICTIDTLASEQAGQPRRPIHHFKSNESPRADPSFQHSARVIIESVSVQSASLPLDPNNYLYDRRIVGKLEEFCDKIVYLWIIKR